MQILDAYQLACRLQGGQVDKAGRPYIEHLTRVFLRVQAAGGDLNQQIAAMLHDSIEDGHVTAEQLAMAGVPAEAVQLVIVLTKRKGQTYTDYLSGVKAVHRAVLVKLADLEDNGNPDRLAALPEQDAQRLQKKYAQAVHFMAA